MDGAEEEFDENHLEPNNAEACYIQGNLLYEKKRFKDAESKYRKAIRINPKHVGAHNMLGFMLEFLYDKPDEAMMEYREILKIDSSNAEAHYKIGSLLYYKFKKFEDAKKEIETAIGLFEKQGFHRKAKEIEKLLREMIKREQVKDLIINDLEQDFDENNLKPNEIVIGPFYTTFGDDKAIHVTCAEYHKKDNDWQPSFVGRFIEDDNSYSLPAESKNPKYIIRRVFIGKEGNLNRYNIIVKIKKGGYHAIGSMAELWHTSGNEHIKEPFLMFIRVYRGKIIGQEKFVPIEKEIEEQYKKRLWAETSKIINRFPNI